MFLRFFLNLLLVFNSLLQSLNSIVRIIYLFISFLPTYVDPVFVLIDLNTYHLPLHLILDYQSISLLNQLLIQISRYFIAITLDCTAYSCQGVQKLFHFPILQVQDIHLHKQTLIFELFNFHFEELNMDSSSL